jgi:hypothetical protein
VRPPRLRLRARAPTRRGPRRRDEVRPLAEERHPERERGDDVEVVHPSDARRDVGRVGARHRDLRDRRRHPGDDEEHVIARARDDERRNARDPSHERAEREKPGDDRLARLARAEPPERRHRKRRGHRRHHRRRAAAPEREACVRMKHEQRADHSEREAGGDGRLDTLAKPHHRDRGNEEGGEVEEGGDLTERRLREREERE